MAHHSVNISAFENTNVSRSWRPRQTARYPEPSELSKTLHGINFYSHPVIVVLGSIGNILAFFVFTKTRLKHVSSARFLAAIAVTDTGFLWTFFVMVLQRNYNINLLTYVGVCQLVMFSHCGFTFLSIWYTVALVVDRFIALYFPSHKASMCTVFRAKLVIVGIGALAVLCYSYITYFYGVVTFLKLCRPFIEFRQHYLNLDKLDIFVVAVLPYIVIAILVLLMLIKSCERNKNATSVDMSVFDSSRRRSSRQRMRPSFKISRVICPVILITLLFNTPQNIIRAIMRFGNNTKPELTTWLEFCRIFYLLNFALKGFLYFSCSCGFRRYFKDFICEALMKVKKSCIYKRQSANPQVIQMEEDPQIINGKSEQKQTAL